MTALRFTGNGDLVNPDGEIVDPTRLDTDQLADLDFQLKDLGGRLRRARHVIDAEIISRLDAAIDAGEIPEQYTFETARYKISVPSRRAARLTDETALRETLLRRATELGIMPLRVEKLFSPKGWRRNQQYWKQFVAEVPQAENVRLEHTLPTSRSVGEIVRLPHVRETNDRVLEVQT